MIPRPLPQLADDLGRNFEWILFNKGFSLCEV
jgi:hypothetical protein